MDRLRAFEVCVTVVSRGGFARVADAPGTSIGGTRPIPALPRTAK